MTDRIAKDAHRALDKLTDTMPLLPADWYRDTNGVVRYKDSDNPVMCGKTVGRSAWGVERCTALFGHEGACRP